MTQLATFRPARRLEQRIQRAQGGGPIRAPQGRAMIAMSGTFTETIKGKIGIVLAIVGGIAVGYFARKPIGKLIAKVS